MVNNITWGQFISLVIEIGCLYYGVVLLLFFRKEIRRLFARKKTADEPGPSREVIAPDQQKDATTSFPAPGRGQGDQAL